MLLTRRLIAPLRTLAVGAEQVGEGNYDPECLTEVAARADEFGQLTRVFQHMVQRVYTREQRLKQQVQELRIEVNKARHDEQVAEITESDYFQHLRGEAESLRKIIEK